MRTNLRAALGKGLLGTLLLALAVSAWADPPLAWPGGARTSGAVDGPARPELPGRDPLRPRPDGLAAPCGGTACILGGGFALTEITAVLETHGMSVENLDESRIAAGDLALCDSLYVTRGGRTPAANQSATILTWVDAGGVMITEFDATTALFEPPWDLFTGTFSGSWHSPSGTVCGGNTVQIVERCTGLADGLPDEWNCSGDPIGVLFVPIGLDPNELKVIARVPGSDADGDGVDDPILASAAYGAGGMVLFFTDFSDFTALEDPRVDCTGCKRTIEDDALLVNAACGRLAGVGAGSVRPVYSCGDGDLVLDLSAETIEGCRSAVRRAWVDDPSAPLSRTVPPDDGAVYEAQLDCDDPECSILLRFEIHVEAPPEEPRPTARDLVDCNPGILVEWSPVVFPEPTGAVYNLYRSEVSCDDALLQPPIALGLTETSWFDTETRDGAVYHYLVEAENGGPSDCEPPGAHHGGIAARGCAGPVDETADAVFPDGVHATLFLTHDGQEVTLDWTGARALGAGEHFHLKKTVGDADTDFVLISPEPYTERQWIESDPSSALQFFDLRVANPCETESADEFPPGR